WSRYTTVDTDGSDGRRRVALQPFCRHGPGLSIAQPVSAGMQWTYDLRGLDLVAWAERAGRELADHVGAGDQVILLTEPIDAAGLTAVQRALGVAGCAMEPTEAAGMRAFRITAAGSGG